MSLANIVNQKGNSQYELFEGFTSTRPHSAPTNTADQIGRQSIQSGVEGSSEVPEKRKATITGKELKAKKRQKTEEKFDTETEQESDTKEPQKLNKRKFIEQTGYCGEVKVSLYWLKRKAELIESLAKTHETVYPALKEYSQKSSKYFAVPAVFLDAIFTSLKNEPSAEDDEQIKKEVDEIMSKEKLFLCKPREGYYITKSVLIPLVKKVKKEFSGKGFFEEGLKAWDHLKSVYVDCNKLIGLLENQKKETDASYELLKRVRRTKRNIEDKSVVSTPTVENSIEQVDPIPTAPPASRSTLSEGEENWIGFLSSSFNTAQQ